MSDRDQGNGLIKRARWWLAWRLIDFASLWIGGRDFNYRLVVDWWSPDER